MTDNEFLRDLISTSAVARPLAALPLWHHLYRWPALRAMERDWPTLRVVR